MRLDANIGRILVAEPDADTRAAMCDLLRDAGHDPIGLSSGGEVLEAARRERPRLVILEVCLPGICGYEVCRRLRNEYGDRVAIVFVSGERTESYDRVAGILLGADDYLCKPVAADELLARVGRLVGAARVNHGADLTPREHEVFRLVEDGLTHKEIADRMCISDKTVGTHVEHIFAKLGVHNRLQAVALSHRHELGRAHHASARH
jgi:two-component system phosphate regulon response regulator OmpR